MKRNIRYATVFLLYMLGILTGMLLGSCGSTSELRTLRNYYYSTEKFFDDMDKSVYDSVLEQMDTDSGSQYLYWREKAEQYEPQACTVYFCSHRISLLLNNARKDRDSMTQEYKLNLVNHQECLSVGCSERRAFKKLNIKDID